MLFLIIFVPRQTCELIVDPKAKVRKLPVKQFNWTKETKIIPDINDRRGFEMMFLIYTALVMFGTSRFLIYPILSKR